MSGLRILPPPYDEDGTPFADVLELREVEDGRSTVWVVYVRCPYECKKGYHIHGAGRDGEDYEGDRVAHCASGAGQGESYIVRAGGDVPRVTLDDPKRKPFATRWNRIKREERAAQRRTEENKALDRRGLVIFSQLVQQRKVILERLRALHPEAGMYMYPYILGEISGSVPPIIRIEILNETALHELEKPTAVEALTQVFSEFVGEPVLISLSLRPNNPPPTYSPPSPPTPPRDPTLPPGRTRRPPTDPLDPKPSV